MGYIIGLVVLVIAVPLLFMMLTRRSGAGSGGIDSSDHGMTVLKPSSDQPSPGAEGAINQPKPGVEGRIPPG